MFVSFCLFIYLFFLPFAFCSLLITALGHIKLTDFGLSKIGLMSCKLIFLVT